MWPRVYRQNRICHLYPQTIIQHLYVVSCRHSSFIHRHDGGLLMPVHRRLGASFVSFLARLLGHRCPARPCPIRQPFRSTWPAVFGARPESAWLNSPDAWGGRDKSP